jgi:hypothetical protein
VRVSASPSFSFPQPFKVKDRDGKVSMLNNLKILLTDLLHLSRDALHIHAGLGIYVIAILVLRRGPASVLPWLVVLCFEMINEVLDLYHEVDFSGAIVDILNTMLWPTIALVTVKYLARKSHLDGSENKREPSVSPGPTPHRDAPSRHRQ